jgi:hypothetical protein
MTDHSASCCIGFQSSSETFSAALSARRPLSPNAPLGMPPSATRGLVGYGPNIVGPVPARCRLHRSHPMQAAPLHAELCQMNFPSMALLASQSAAT